ncbi:MAG: cell division protein FtsL [Pseudomonadota bacterium]
MGLREVLPLCFLALIALATAFAVIASTHRVRGTYAELQTLEGERWYLEEEHSRLLLEQGTWSSHHRIETEARAVLGLVTPGPESVRVLEP